MSAHDNTPMTDGPVSGIRFERKEIFRVPDTDFYWQAKMLAVVESVHQFGTASIEIVVEHKTREVDKYATEDAGPFTPPRRTFLGVKPEPYREIVLYAVRAI